MRRPQNWNNLPPVLTKQLFLLSSAKTRGRFFSKFCGLFRKAELYYSQNTTISFDYRTHAFISCSLYTFTKIFKTFSLFSRRFFQKILSLCMVSIQERFEERVMMAHLRCWFFWHKILLFKTHHRRSSITELTLSKRLMLEQNSVVVVARRFRRTVFFRAFKIHKLGHEPSMYCKNQLGQASAPCPSSTVYIYREY